MIFLRGIPVSLAMLYWRDSHTGAVYGQGKTGSADVTTISKSGSGADLDVNAFVVYWNNDSVSVPGMPAVAAGIVSARNDGTGSRYLDSDTALQPGELLSPRVDDAHVFYVRGGSIMRILR